MGKEAFFQALIAGKSGIGPISTFPTEGLGCKIAGKIRDFEPFRWISRKDLPHVPRTVPMALAAVSEALTDARLDVETLSLNAIFGRATALRRDFGQWRRCSGVYGAVV